MKRNLTWRFMLLFTVCSTIGTFFLRYLSCFLYYNKPAQFTGGIASSAGALMGLAFIFNCMFYRPLCKADATVYKLENGIDVPEEERISSMGCYSKISRMCIAANTLGFFVGQIFVMGSAFAKGNLPFVPLRAVLIMLQSILVGGVAALYEIYGLNYMLMPMRRLLAIHSIEGFGKKSWKITISNKFLLITIAALSFCSCNMFLSGCYIVLEGATLSEAERISKYLFNGLFTFVFSIVFSIGLLLIITHELKSRIYNTSVLIKNLGEKGDLSSRINLEMNDDLSELSGSMNMFMNQLSVIIHSLHKEAAVVKKSAEIVAGAVSSASSANDAMAQSIQNITEESKVQTQLVASVESNATSITESALQVHEQVEVQSTTMQQSSASVNEMAANIQSVTELTRKADSLSVDLQTMSREGGSCLSSAVTTINELQSASAEIQDAMKIIQSIASQTNLLSMNAAIEAAHAGDAGAGFAVVADEVRSLASTSSKSAKTIQMQIKSMIERINAGAESIHAAGKAFASITSDVEMTVSLMQTIAKAMEEQSIGAKETLEASESATESIHIIAELCKKQTEATHEMQNIIKQLASSSALVEQAIKKNISDSAEMNTAISNVSSAAESNKQAVLSMEKDISLFTVA